MTEESADRTDDEAASTDAEAESIDAEAESTDAEAASTGEGFEPDPERVDVLREIAEDVRGESSESEQLANVLYRTSDIYDPDEETTPEDVVQNVKFILEVKERGGLGR